ncbi:MAG: NAD(P)/FAD-dependent oxidoreductase [Pygmaiobacter massiliensis]|nr:NAD(P)/FAD-dependent oxidoreductase [Pygmaiobacter massiliensis]
MYDVLIIGAGVVGCAVARYLSGYTGSICVLEKEEDVCCGTSKANSAIVHAGFDAPAGSKKAKYNVAGSQIMPQLARRLQVPYRQIGSLVVCQKEENLPKLRELAANGAKNGVEGLKIIGSEHLAQMEPALAFAAGALWAPTGGIICPFELTIALAENACANGVEFFFDTVVNNIKRNGKVWQVETSAGQFEAKCVVNAAGVYADQIHNLVSQKTLSITPRRGEYFLLDHSAGQLVRHTVFGMPSEKGKGVLISPTVHGNLIVGPNAQDLLNRQDTATTPYGLDEVSEKAKMFLPDLPLGQTITCFAGLRAHELGQDFVVGPVEDAPGFFDCAGIESPGLSAAPAIGQRIAGMVADTLGLAARPDWQPDRAAIPNPRAMSWEQRAQLIEQNAAYGRVICRCEGITEGEIVEAICRKPGARSLDGVKRRTRAGMGRCQSGFCGPKVQEILARQLNIAQEAVTKNGKGSFLVTGQVKK